MIRKDTSAVLEKQPPGCLWFFGKAPRLMQFSIGKGRDVLYAKFDDDASFRNFEIEEQRRPVQLVKARGRTWWAFRGAVYWEDEDRSAADMQVLLLEREAKDRRKIDKLRREQSASEE